MKEKTNTKQMLSIPDENIRFMRVLEFYGYSGYKLAKEVKNVSEAKVTHIRSGRNKPSLDLINVLLDKFPNINKTWLLTGEGTMLSAESPAAAKEPQVKKEKIQKELTTDEKINLLLERTSEILVMNQNLLEENKKLSAEREELKDAYENLDSKFDNLTLLFDMYMSPIYRSMGLNRIDMKEVKEQITKSEK